MSQSRSTPPVRYLEVPASPSLQRVIAKFYNVTGYTSDSSPFLEKTLPNGYTSMVFHFGKKIQVDNVTYDGTDIPQHYLFGKYTQLIRVTHTFGKVDTFGIIFQPGAFRRLCGESQQVFTNKLYGVVDVLGKDFQPYLHRLEDASFLTWPISAQQAREILHARRSVMEEFLARRLYSATFTPDLVDALLEQILQLPQNASLKRLSLRYNTSPQYLNRKFNQEIGLSIWRYARIIRFNYLIHTYDQHPEYTLQRLVAEFDYTDVPHLIRDFWLFAGDRPKDFLDTQNKLARFLLHH